MGVTVYIDGANLHKASRELGSIIDYKRFINWLRQKYKADTTYLFVGYVSKNKQVYKKLKEFGYTLIFKEVVLNSNGSVKGNCDADLVLQVCSDFYTKHVGRFIIVTGDGDFRCLIDFLLNNKKEVLILSPNIKKCSTLLKKVLTK